MRTSRSLYALLLMTVFGFVTACGNKSAAPAPQTSRVTLEQVRSQAEKALDVNRSSDQRQRAREATVRAMVEFLKLPDSVRVNKAEWEKPVPGGTAPMVRLFESGSVRVIGLMLPGPGVVPPGERVLVQVNLTSGPQAAELAALPGGQVMSAKTLEDGGQTLLTLAFSMARGGGYVAHYQRDSRTGEFRPNVSVFKGLPAKIGDLSLEVRNNFLIVASPVPEAWRPRFDAKQPLRLYFDADLALDWKSRFVLLDERNFSTFQGFHTALDAKAPKADRDQAWDKATRKLPAYLQEMDSWTEDLTAKLPAGATVNRDQQANLAVRLVSIPVPDSEQSFTVIQHRSGGGLPAAQAITLPGVVESLRMTSRQGLPGLVVLMDATPRGAKGTPVARKAVTLLRFTSGGDWETAPDWFGFLPVDAAWSFQRPANSANLTIEWNPVAFPQASVMLLPEADPSVRLCENTTGCFSLTWAGDRLGGTGWLAEKLKTATSASATAQQVMSAAEDVKQYLLMPDIQALGTAQLAVTLSKAAGLDIPVYDAGANTRVVGLPLNGSGVVPVIIQADKNVVIESTAPRIIDRWVGARAVEGGGARWLVVAGKGTDSGAVLLYRWDGSAWQAANALDDRYDNMIAERIRISYAPGQTTPVRGLYVRGGPELTVSVGPDGSVALCEGTRACTNYVFDSRWQMR